MIKKKSDTLEDIVAEAIAREQEINALHPERNGYGMMGHEADDLIYRIRKLEYKEDMAQQVKSDRIKRRVRIVNNDQLYARSPEDVALNNIYRQRVNRAEKKVVDGLSERSRQIYDMKDKGMKLTDVGKIINLHVSNVSRDYHKSIDKLKEEFIKVIGKEREHD